METKKESCPKIEKCPIFTKGVFMNSSTGETYKNRYCLAGKDKYTSCKRFQVAQEVNKPIPETIYPNSSLDIASIIKRYELDKD